MDDSDQYMEDCQNDYDFNNDYEDESSINNYKKIINCNENIHFQNRNNVNTDDKINKLYSLVNLYENISLYNLKNEEEKNNIRTNNIINLLIFIFSGFNIKIKETPNMNNIFQNEIDLKNNINNINLILKFLNSKFIIKNNISSKEYLLLTVYFIDFFDFFKELLDFLKNKHNESLISFNNIFKSLDESNEDDVNNFDNLKKIENETSNSVLESYNKLHFIISNIKKQLDSLVNNIFKLNEFKIKQSLGKYKIEELILFCGDNKLFENYKKKFLYSAQNNFINKYLLNIIEAIKLFPDLYDILYKESKNNILSDDIINNGYISSLKGKENTINKVDKTKLNIIQRLIELKFNLQNLNIKNFDSFFKELQNKIDYNISEIKNKNNQIINNEEFTTMLNQVLMQLNSYINQNIIDLNNIIQSNINIENVLKEIENAQKMFLENNKDIWEIYSQYLFSVKEFLEIFYKKNMININQIIKQKEERINKDYIILNKEK